VTYDDFIVRVFNALRADAENGIPVAGYVVHIHPDDGREIQRTMPGSRWADPDAYHVFGVPLVEDMGVDPGKILLRREVAV